MSESPEATSESAGEGVAVTGVRLSQIVSVTQSPATYRIGPGGGGGNWCPGVMRQCWSRVLQPRIRTESAREGVAVTGVRLSQIVSVTQSPATYRIGPGGRGGSWCPGVMQSCPSQNCYHTRNNSTTQRAPGGPPSPPRRPYPLAYGSRSPFLLHRSCSIARESLSHGSRSFDSAFRRCSSIVVFDRSRLAASSRVDVSRGH